MTKTWCQPVQDDDPRGVPESNWGACPDCTQEGRCEVCHARWLYFIERAAFGALFHPFTRIPEA